MKPSKWKPTEKRFVAFLDIMGFKSLVKEKRHADILRIMHDITSLTKQIERLEKEKLKNPGPDRRDLWSKSAIVLPAVFSDSILLSTNGCTVAAAEKIILVSLFIYQNLVSQGIPIKGAIAAGSFTFDQKNSIYFGQPLIDAYLLQEEVYFYGLVLHHTFERKITKNSKLRAKYGIEFKKLPLKGGDANHLLINPLKSYRKVYTEIEEFSRFYTSVSGKIRRYVDNTYRVYELDTTDSPRPPTDN